MTEQVRADHDRVAEAPVRRAWWSETRGPAGAGAGRDGLRVPAPRRVAGTACADDTWTPTLQLLDPRYWHTAVWTGSEMIVFGGMSSVGTTYGDGSRYDPATDTWTLLPAIGSPGATPVARRGVDRHGDDRLGRPGRRQRRPLQPGDRHLDADLDRQRSAAALAMPASSGPAREMIVWGGDGERAS